MINIKLFNRISAHKLAALGDHYRVGEEVFDPNVFVVRSTSLHDEPIPDCLELVVRAGAGTNNIPIDDYTNRGIPVFNTPGANANAVKELVLAGILLAARNICAAWEKVNSLQAPSNRELTSTVERIKNEFKGTELPQKTLTVIGLGQIGVSVANAAHALGMRVVGYDACMSVHNAWRLSQHVILAQDITQALAQADFVSLHVPLLAETKSFMNAEYLNVLQPHAVLLNFSRGAVVDNAAVLHALSQNKLGMYVTDFPDIEFQGNNKVIALPHLGASTFEAEDHCAEMAVTNIKAYFETGEIFNCVNFPEVRAQYALNCERLAVIHKNIPNMVAEISKVISEAGINIVNMVNASRGEIAYSLLDLDTINDDVLQGIGSIADVVRVRRVGL